MARLHVRVQPNASRSRSGEWVGWFGDVPKLAVAAPPVDGAANAAAIRAVAQLCGVPERSVRLVGGASSRSKRFEVDAVTASEIEHRLIAVIGRGPNSDNAR